MKKLITKKAVYMLLTIFILFQSCNNDEIIIDDLTIQENHLEQDNLLDKLLDKGFDINNIVKTNDGLIVEGDLLFEFGKTYPFLENENQVNRQTSSSNSISLNYRVISVGISSEVSSSWNAATVAAIAEWSKICNVRMFITSDYQNANIKVYYNTSPDPGIVASATFPNSSGQPGNHVKINNNNYSHYSIDQKTAVMVHEMGHNLGFLHSTNSNGNTVSNIPNTPNSDPLSIMAYNIGGTSWSSRYFSQNDFIASTYLLGDIENTTPLIRYTLNNNVGKNYSVGTINGLNNLEKIIGYTYNNSTSAPSNTQTLFKVHKNGDYVLTTNSSEAFNNGYIVQGILGKVSTVNNSVTNTPLYEFYDANSNRHFYTGFYWEYYLLGYTPNGIIGYMISKK